jgi:hypothetical protein
MPIRTGVHPAIMPIRTTSTKPANIGEHSYVDIHHRNYKVKKKPAKKLDNFKTILL